jgi:hypothetical protein
LALQNRRTDAAFQTTNLLPTKPVFRGRDGVRGSCRMTVVKQVAHAQEEARRETLTGWRTS